MVPGPVDATGASAAIRAATGVEKPERATGAGFQELVTGVLEDANRQQLESAAKAQELATGEGDVVETLLAVSRADLSLRFVVSLRNRALEAYNEIMRLQV